MKQTRIAGTSPARSRRPKVGPDSFIPEPKRAALGPMAPLCPACIEAAGRQYAGPDLKCDACGHVWRSTREELRDAVRAETRAERAALIPRVESGRFALVSTVCAHFDRTGRMAAE